MPIGALIACLLSVALASVPARSAQQPPDLSAKAVVLAAGRYVDDYQKQLSFLLAQEEGTQEVFGPDVSSPPRLRRTTKAEVFLTFLDADRVWLAVRDVTEVDGQPLSRKTDLRALLTAGPLSGLARTLADESSRYNIGRISRNFNEPTLGLLVLDQKHRARFKFDRRKIEASDAGPLVTLAFSEKEPPTLIQNDRGGDIFSKGEMVVEAATGRVRETSLEINTGGVRAKLDTTYAPESRLDLWVPVTLTERYTDESDKARTHETTVCQSKYTDYKRFDVQVRIK